MAADIVEQLKKKGFEIVHFVNEATGEKTYQNISLQKITNADLLFLLKINPETAALSGELDTLFVSGAPAFPERTHTGFALLKYEIQTASK